MIMLPSMNVRHLLSRTIQFQRLTVKMRAGAVLLQQQSYSTSASNPEKEKPRFRAFNSFRTNHGARNALIAERDYCFLDSDRDVPIGARERFRLKRQHELAADVLRLLKEIQFAKEYGGVAGEERREDQRRQHVIQNKLKSKEHMKIDPLSEEIEEKNSYTKSQT
ncbi:39S ribosomal protein L52, mitochondrial [Hyalella azteca]|uniref:39S ribosomal protein L52, mitochondrial n=1 Tax=Hyalella azteca TaxID=294128 RepID=A0A8B7PG64_HYAAZ|nr:39S ribosomal protein L52, mitochondrial [Hyalella azteca]